MDMSSNAPNLDTDASRMEDITQSARERFGATFFKTSPQAFLVENLKNAAKGNRVLPDWWHEVRRAEARMQALVTDAGVSDRSRLGAAESCGWSTIASRWLPLIDRWDTCIHGIDLLDRDPCRCRREFGGPRQVARGYLGVVRNSLGAGRRGSSLLQDLDDAVQEVFIEFFRDGKRRELSTGAAFPTSGRSFLVWFATLPAASENRPSTRRGPWKKSPTTTASRNSSMHLGSGDHGGSRPSCNGITRRNAAATRFAVSNCGCASRRSSHPDHR